MVYHKIQILCDKGDIEMDSDDGKHFENAIVIDRFNNRKYEIDGERVYTLAELRDLGELCYKYKLGEKFKLIYHVEWW